MAKKCKRITRSGFRRLANGGSAGYNYTDPNTIDTNYAWGDVGAGAASGLAAGSSFGPIGMAAGAVIGAGVSAFGASKAQDAARDQQDAIKHQNAISKGQYDRTRMDTYNQSIGNQYSYYKKGGKIKKIGSALQVNGEQGTDTIPMNIDGEKVMLDNNEIVVRDINGEPVVLSDDLGTADKYRKGIKSGKNPKAMELRLAEEAKMLNPNPMGNGRFTGGGIDGIQPRKYMGNLNEGNVTLNPNNINTIQPRTIDTNIPLLNDNRNTMNESLNYAKNNPVKIGQAASFLGTAIGNINAANKLNKTRMQPYKTAVFNPMNPDANRPIYSDRISDIKRSGRNLNKQILSNTSNSNVALARLNALKSNEANQINTVNSQRIADRNRILNQNTSQSNSINLANNRGLNQYNQALYGDQVGRINTNLGLTGSTIASVDNIISNIQKGDYQTEQLQALSNQYNLGLDMNKNTVDDFITALQQLQGKRLNTITDKK